MSEQVHPTSDCGQSDPGFSVDGDSDEPAGDVLGLVPPSDGEGSVVTDEELVAKKNLFDKVKDGSIQTKEMGILLTVLRNEKQLRDRTRELHAMGYTDDQIVDIIVDGGGALPGKFPSSS